MQDLLRKRPLALFVFVLALAAVAGCGGDTKEAPPRPTVQTYDPEASTEMTTASLTRAEFVRRMNGTCRRAWATVWDNWRVYSRTQDRKQSKRARTAEAIELSLLAGIDFHIFDNFRAIGAPPGDERRLEATIEPFQAAVELGWEKIEPVSTFAEVAELFGPYNKRALAYGLDDCVVDGPHLRKLEA